MDLNAYLKKQAQKIDHALLKVLPRKSERISALAEAMHYAALQGGKRVRPILLLEAARIVQGSEKVAMPAACAVELVHSYSLVHDDLPCMDDDAMRRGKPSCHAKFGQVTALLAGDALLTLAFEVLSRTRNAEAISLLAQAAGVHGMVGGQAVDMEYQDKTLDVPTLEFINTHKSGSLIAASLRLGALVGGGKKRDIEALYRYGKCVGLLFQMVDDLLDGEGYASLLGPGETKKLAFNLCGRAKKELAGFGSKAKNLNHLADFILERKN